MCRKNHKIADGGDSQQVSRQEIVEPVEEADLER